MTLWRQIVVNDCLQKLIFNNTSESFSIKYQILCLNCTSSCFSFEIRYFRQSVREGSFGRRWIQKGINVYLYFMIFCNINNVYNNCHFISISDLRSSKNEIDSAGRPNSWRGDWILKQLILRKRDSEDIKLWTKQYKRSVIHCIFILCMFYLGTFTTGLHRNRGIECYVNRAFIDIVHNDEINDAAFFKVFFAKYCHL